MILRKAVVWFLVAALSVLTANFAPDSLVAQGVATRNVQAVPRGTPSGKPFPVAFVDVAMQSGLSMQFTQGDEKSKKYIVEANGTGVAFLDYDNDGWLDAFLVNASRLGGLSEGQKPTSHLYRNRGGGSFDDVTSKAGLTRHGWGNGVCAGDVDNDGHIDLFVTYWGPNALYRNSGDGTFHDVAPAAGVAGPAKEWSSGCTFVDYDRDGLLDLLVTSYLAFDPKTTPLPGKGSGCEWKGVPVLCGPRGLPYGTSTLYHNRGGWVFEDVSLKAGIRAVKDYYPLTAIAADLDRDGWVDLYIACDSTPSIFFQNNQDGTFTDIATETGLAYNEHGFEQAGMGIGVGDFDRDGWLDLAKTNFSGDYPNLYHHLAGSVFDDIVVRSGIAVNPQYVGWGIDFVDLDNDGWQDLFQANGHVYPEFDSQNPTAESYRQPSLVYRNLGGQRFEDVSSTVNSALAEKRSSRGAAFGDFDGDGDIDVLMMNMGEHPSLLRNGLKSGNHWIEVRLQGTKSNRSAIGATVLAQVQGQPQTKAVLSQSSYISHSDLRVHFGLGESKQVDKFTVYWPTGKTEDFPGVGADQRYLLIENSGQTQVLPKPR